MVRASASANPGLWVPGSPSDMPFANRLTVSTPPATNTSPSPALMAWAAIRMVCSDEEQYRFTVAPGAWAMPARMPTTRATL